MRNLILNITPVGGYGIRSNTYLSGFRLYNAFSDDVVIKPYKNNMILNSILLRMIYSGISTFQIHIYKNNILTYTYNAIFSNNTCLINNINMELMINDEFYVLLKKSTNTNEIVRFGVSYLIIS